MNEVGSWKTTLRADDEGKFTSDLWQQGEFTIFVRSPTLGSSHITVEELRGVDKVDLTLRLPKREISVAVFDTATRMPIQGAFIALETFTEQGMSSVTIRTTADGRGAFRAIKPGRQQLTAEADRYISPEPIIFEMSEAETARDIEIALRRGALRTIRAIWQMGNPVSDARVFVTLDGRFVSEAATDAAGYATVVLPPDLPAAVFVTPKEGSFAVIRILDKPGTEEEVVGVILGEPSATLQVTVTSSDGKPLRGIQFRIRYNGEIVPPEAIRVIQKAGFWTDDNGILVMPAFPPGHYELWPFRSDEEGEAILQAGMGYSAPIRLDVATGLNKILVKFQPKRL